MAETSRSTASNLSQPPPAPPLPPSHKPSVLQRFIALPAFARPQRQQGTPVAQSASASPKDTSQDRPSRPIPARNAVHRTGIPISAIDINEQGTHAILAGRDILKTVQVQDRAIHEDLNIRNKVNAYVSTQQLKQEDIRKRRNFLPAKDVRWSHGQFAHVVATAAQDGRVALYDVTTMGSSRVELAYLYPHEGQVNKLDFDPHSGYMLLSGSQDKHCKIQDIRNPRSPTAYNQYNVRAPIRDVRWSPTNAYDFALCTEAGVVQLWDVRNPSQVRTSINAHSKSCYTIAWHPDGRHLASGGLDKALRIWDMKSENKGQKHALQLRCPHGIMNLAWRPPAWSADFAKRGTWQTCHIATSYTEDDPRTHVWDLRRPLLPFRELNHYETRPMDLLWANKDLLWTVGGAGIFAQSDISHLAQVEESLPPGAVEWCADGAFYAVVENRTTKPYLSASEPSAIFLNVPQDRLSGVEDGTASRSLTDDEATDASFAEHSRRQSRTTTTRTKSHPNTPPFQDYPHKVMPLDRTVVGQRELFINGQVGAVNRIQGVHFPTPLVEFIANNYAHPMTAKERSENPNEILPRLRSAFLLNAKVCEAAGMTDVAANWNLMTEVIIPELKNSADNNRKRRLYDEENKKKEEELRKGKTLDSLSPLPKMTPQGKDGKSPAASEKFISNVFRGVVDSHRGSSDSGTQGNSNMTTPRQHPLPNSPPTSKKDASMWFTLDDAIEPMQPLPPSLANAHSTAAIASRTLLDNNSDPSNSPMSSPERSRQSPDKLRGHRRSATESATTRLDGTTIKDVTKDAANVPPSDRQTLFINRNQEDRRAALRNFRAPSRQPFSLEATTAYGREVRHDSSESFPMFSASGGSSAKDRSFGRSFDTTDPSETPFRSRQDSDDWLNKEGYSQHIDGSDEYDEIAPRRSVRDPRVGQGVDPTVDESLSLPFSLDGASESRPVPTVDAVMEIPKELLSRSPRNHGLAKQKIIPTRDIDTSAINESLFSVSNESTHGFFARQYHLNNPLFHAVKASENLGRISEYDVSTRSSYHALDFRPIDITSYQPCAPCFAVSAYPIICEAIRLDTEQGPASAQFSTHLLSHIYPFFFHHSTRKSPSQHDLAAFPATLADRLLNPCFSSRVIENIFATHIEYLRSLNLYIPAAEIRKLCVEDFDYRHLAGPEASTDAASVGDKLKIDPLKLKCSCSNCKTLLSTNASICKECNYRVQDCPICDRPLTAGNSDVDERHHFIQSPLQGNTPITVYCHTCGHSAHLSCMTTWLSLPDTYGECPTPECGCDCGPGLLRDQRIARQIEANENAPNQRGSIAASVKRDSRVVGPIPAVDKARDTLRKRGSGAGFGNGSSVGGLSGERMSERDRDEKSTPSSGGTGTSVWSKKGTSAASGRPGAPGMGRSNSGGAGSVSASAGASASYGGTSFGRRVRVVEPDK